MCNYYIMYDLNIYISDKLKLINKYIDLSFPLKKNLAITRFGSGLTRTGLRSTANFIYKKCVLYLTQTCTN